MDFTMENVVARTKELRKEFGSASKLSQAAGCSIQAVYNYSNPKYLKRHGCTKKTWEKWFGPWDSNTAETVNPVVPEEPVEEDIIEVATAETPDKEQTEPEPTTEKRKARLVIEVPSLEELEETLSSFGFRLEFIPR